MFRVGISNNYLFTHPVRDIIIYTYMYRQDCITTEIKVVGGYFCDLLIHTDASLLNLAFVEKSSCVDYGDIGEVYE